MVLDNPFDKLNEKKSNGADKGDHNVARPAHELAAEGCLSRLQEDSRSFGSSISQGFKERAHDAVQNPENSITRGAVSVGVATLVTLATRDKGMAASIALSTGGAAAIQSIWSIIDNKNSKDNAGKSVASRLGHELGSIAFDATALGAAPGAISSLSTRGAMQIYESSVSKQAFPSIMRDSNLSKALDATRADAGSAEGASTSFLNMTEIATAKDSRAIELASALTPVNAWSRSPEPIGRELSNFAHTPFVLDDKKYASIEGFYNSLLYKDPARRAKIAEMFGMEAKLAGNDSNLTVTPYGKKMITLGSEDHHELVERALRAKIEQNPTLREAFVDTHPRPIIHDTGAPDKPGAHFPREVLEGILNKIRAEYVAERNNLLNGSIEK